MVTRRSGAGRRSFRGMEDTWISRRSRVGLVFAAFSVAVACSTNHGTTTSTPSSSTGSTTVSSTMPPAASPESWQWIAASYSPTSSQFDMSPGHTEDEAKHNTIRRCNEYSTQNRGAADCVVAVAGTQCVALANDGGDVWRGATGSTKQAAIDAAKAAVGTPVASDDIAGTCVWEAGE
jgi:Domain of unknown function (DUF4189)